MARYSRYGNHGSEPFPEYSILGNNWLIIYEAISKAAEEMTIWSIWLIFPPLLAPSV